MLMENWLDSESSGVYQAREIWRSGKLWASAIAFTRITILRPHHQAPRYEVFDLMGKNPLLEIALECERIALEDDYFRAQASPQCGLYNRPHLPVHGFPHDHVSRLFAIAHLKDGSRSGKRCSSTLNKKSRGPPDLSRYDTRHYVPIDQRS